MGKPKLKTGNVITSLEEHAGFVVPLSVTYFFGFIFVFITYYTSEPCDQTQSQLSYFFKLLLDSLIPTTITYVLCEVVNSLLALFEKKNGHFLLTISTLIAVVLYEAIFLVYQLSPGIGWTIILVFSTLGILVLNGLSYKERYQVVHRNHGLV